MDHNICIIDQKYIFIEYKCSAEHFPHYHYFNPATIEEVHEPYCPTCKKEGNDGVIMKQTGYVKIGVQTKTINRF